MKEPLGPPDEQITQGEFWEGRRSHDPAALAKYAGQWVAWSPDGKIVLASAVTFEELEQKIKSETWYEARDVITEAFPAAQ